MPTNWCFAPKVLPAPFPTPTRPPASCQPGAFAARFRTGPVSTGANFTAGESRVRRFNRRRAVGWQVAVERFVGIQDAPRHAGAPMIEPRVLRTEGPARYGYFVIQAKAAGDGSKVSGTVENLGTGETQAFASSQELAECVASWAATVRAGAAEAVATSRAHGPNDSARARGGRRAQRGRASARRGVQRGHGEARARGPLRGGVKPAASH